MAANEIHELARPYKVYCLINLVNGKRYFGLTKRLVQARMAQHQGEARRGSPRLISRAIRKYGWGAFAVEIVAEGLTQEEACDLEVSLIARHDTSGAHGYNVAEGGQHGVSARPETKVRRSEAAKAAWKESDAWQRSIHCPERLRKIAQASKRAHQKPDYRAAFMARQKAMVQASLAKDVRAAAIETFKSNGHAVAVIMQGGRRFDTASDAARWVRLNTIYKKAGISNILMCAKGKRPRAYGFSWSLG